MSEGRARVLILGGTGMLGHKLWQVLRQRVETWTTVRGARPPALELYESPNVIPTIDALDDGGIARALETSNPNVIVNCVGLVKQLREAADPIAAITLNALLPHRLVAQARRIGARVIHISTDCVFAGTRGHYAEQDAADADDLYGRTKYLGEIAGPNCLTLRTSIVGREITGAHGLVEWFLSRRGGRASGFTHARFSGVTTQVLSVVIGDVIERQRHLEGVYQVAAAPIAKYDLLVRLNQEFDAGVTLEPSDAVRIDRTLDGRAFAAATGFTPPSWDHMVQELANDPTPYDDWRKTRV
jgi:dTDP-4-dehydrorhamnose reductase